MKAQLSKWPEDKIKTPERRSEERDGSMADYLKLIFWVVTVAFSVIITGGGFFISQAWSKVSSMEASLTQMNVRGVKLSRRMAFIEVVNREIAEKQGLNLKTLEGVRDLQEHDDLEKTTNN